MRTNVELDDVLVKRAMELTKISTKKALLNKALEESETPGKAGGLNS